MLFRFFREFVFLFASKLFAKPLNFDAPIFMDCMSVFAYEFLVCSSLIHFFFVNILGVFGVYVCACVLLNHVSPIRWRSFLSQFDSIDCRHMNYIGENIEVLGRSFFLLKRKLLHKLKLV